LEFYKNFSLDYVLNKTLFSSAKILLWFHFNTARNHPSLPHMDNFNTALTITTTAQVSVSFAGRGNFNSEVKWKR
jgi:hypothetical protein